MSVDTAAANGAVHARSISIDCLRGFAVLWVLLYHLSGYHLFMRTGVYGVLLFFIISGYCISISAASSNSAWHFYSKRLGRLLPALVVCGFLTTALKAYAPELTEPSKVTSWFDFAYSLIALPTLNLLRIDYLFPDGAYWSLQTEFYFYFIYACLLGVGLNAQQLLRCLCVVAAFHTITTSIATVMITYLPFFIAGVSVAAARDGRYRDAAFGFVVAAAIDLYELKFHMIQPSIPVSPTRTFVLWGGAAAVWLAASFDIRSGWAKRMVSPLWLIGRITTG